MSDEFKAEIWQMIIQGKIRNQARVMDLRRIPREKSGRMLRFAEEVIPGDQGNREGVAAKWYFRAIYGSAFIRRADDAINAALNYGYAIIRSAVGKTLTAYGYNCVIGLHHINENNPFNLADDMMEPLRPMVDFWVDQNSEDLTNTLSQDNRRELVNLINQPVRQDNKRMSLRNAIDRYVSSLTTAIERQNPKLIKIPLVIDTDAQMGDKGDE